jgi:uncharacterized protein (UPF0548 family)
MFTLFKPSDEQIEKFLAEQKDLSFSYEEVGCSQNAIPLGYPINHHRIQLGYRADVFDRAKNAIQNWTMYQLDWTRLYPPNAPIAAQEVVCVVANHHVCWSLNPCRIVYVLEGEAGTIRRYGFAFGTLPGHSEEGEERFTVEWRQEDDSVWYELLSFARPHHFLAKIGTLFVEPLKQRFAAQSQRAMLKAINNK